MNFTFTLGGVEFVDDGMQDPKAIAEYWRTAIGALEAIAQDEGCDEASRRQARETLKRLTGGMMSRDLDWQVRMLEVLGEAVRVLSPFATEEEKNERRKTA